MRKYYADLLQGNSEYKRKMRNIKLKHKMLMSCSTSLSTDLNLPDCHFFLAAIAFPNDLRKILIKAEQIKPDFKREFVTCRQIIDTIDCALTRYSKKVLDEFIKIPEICDLLLHYLNKRTHPEYADHYKMLKEMAAASIEKSQFISAFKAFRIENRIFDIVNSE